jgi:hypothetical protein
MSCLIGSIASVQPSCPPPVVLAAIAGAGSWKASTSDNGNGTYAVTFKVDRAGPWVIVPK